MSTLSTRFALHLPDHWTPEQALAVYEWLNELAEAIWNQYANDLLPVIAPELAEDDAAQPDLFEPNDELPF